MSQPIRVLLSGFPEEDAVAVRVESALRAAGVDPTVVTSADYLPSRDFYTRHPAAAVQLDKREIAECDVLLVDLDNGAAESLTHMMWGYFLEKGVVGVTQTTPTGGWITSHCAAVLPDFNAALSFLVAWLRERKPVEEKPS